MQTEDVQSEPTCLLKRPTVIWEMTKQNSELYEVQIRISAEREA